MIGAAIRFLLRLGRWWILTPCLAIGAAIVATIALPDRRVPTESVSPAPTPPALQIGAATGSGPNSPIASATSIRVNLTPVPVRELKIAVERPCRVHPVGDDRLLGEERRLEATAVTVAPTGIRIGPRTYAAGRIEIDAGDAPAIWVGDHRYRGTLRLFRRSGGRLLAVNVVPLEDYIASEVDSEMPAAFPEAARRAQAIAARTYALYQARESRGHPFFDLYDSARSQRYLGNRYRSNGRLLAGESESARQIVRDTQGMVCTYRGRLFCTYYSAVCGGRTIRGKAVFSDAAPPLAGVTCNWCREAERYRWSARIPRDEASGALRRAFLRSGREFDSLQSIGFAQAPATSEPLTFFVDDGRHRYELAGADLRAVFSSARLNSPYFAAQLDGGDLVFEGRGHGHAVGLCQWGARGLALAGHGTLDILRHYYQGAEVVVLQPNSD